MEFKDRLRTIREESNTSRAKLAAELGKSESTISMWETGKSKPDIDILVTLATYFNCTTDYLLGVSNVRNYESDKKDIEIDHLRGVNALNEKYIKELQSHAQTYLDIAKTAVKTITENGNSNETDKKG